MAIPRRLFAPSTSDSDTASSRRYTRWNEFVPALLNALDARGYRPDGAQTWSHHNYSDVEYRTPAATRLQREPRPARRPLAGSEGQARPCS